MFDALAYRPPEIEPTPAPIQPTGQDRAAINWSKKNTTVRRDRMEAFDGSGSRDAAAMRKMALIRDRVVTPALTGAELAKTRAILAEILRGAPASANGHRAGRWLILQRIFWWVRSRIRYVLDPSRRELFQAVGVTLANGIGDCDDQTALVATLAKAAGFRVAARVIRLTRDGGYRHIYPVALLEGPRGAQWVALDTTAPHPPGWEPRHAKKLELEL